MLPSSLVVVVAVAANIVTVILGVLVGVRRVQRAAAEAVETQEYRRKQQMEAVGRQIRANSAKIDELLATIKDGKDGTSS